MSGSATLPSTTPRSRLAISHSKIPLSHLRGARDLMNAVLPTATVIGYEAIIPSIVLPDADDRHVVAAAVTAGASVIVTWNVRDFPTAELRLAWAEDGNAGCLPGGPLRRSPRCHGPRRRQSLS